MFCFRSDYVDAPVTMKTFPGTHDKLGSYAARFAFQFFFALKLAEMSRS